METKEALCSSYMQNLFGGEDTVPRFIILFNAP